MQQRVIGTKCPECGSTHTWSRWTRWVGSRPNKRQVKVFECQACGFSFRTTPDTPAD